jgi:hypothetical protein
VGPVPEDGRLNDALCFRFQVCGRFFCVGACGAMFRLHPSKEELQIGSVTEARDGRGTVIRAPVTGAGSFDQIWFRVSERVTGAGATPFLPATLFCAMKQGLPLRLSDPVSRQVFESVPCLQAIFNKWHPQCKKIPVHASTGAPSRAGSGVGCFFSGGLDSFYSVLKHRREIDTLIFVHGFDIWLDDERLRDRVAGELRRIAEGLGKRLIEVETNLREYTDQFLDWGLHVFGSGLASVAHVLSPLLRQVYIPSSRSFAHLESNGSHPLLDPLWGSERTRIIHDGCEATRIEKVRAISECSLALESLRVCYQNLHERGRYDDREGHLNCGRCEKCVRTMLNLHAAGALDRCPTFAAPLTPDLVRRTDPGSDAAFFHMEDNLRALQEKEGEHAEMVRALRQTVEAYRRRRIVQRMDANAEGFLRSAAWKGFVERHRNGLVKSLWPVLKSWLTRELLKEEIKRAGRRVIRRLPKNPK